ncbi:DUF7079 family protein [Zooshikella ganghwensis]|uniref:DUF7079 family protein n=1 Tax=Zooshikella ganghwensis TaxID=202772 RepID=UPI0003FC84DE
MVAQGSIGAEILKTDELYTAWIAISDLFLDTELKRSDIKFIVRRLAETAFSEEQLTEFYLYDVAPVCHINALPPHQVESGWHLIKSG